MKLRFLIAVTLLSIRPAHAAASTIEAIDPDRIFQAADVDTTPEIVKTTAPVYPPVLRGSGTVGMAAVAVVVDQMGDIESIEVIRASSQDFAKAAQECVRYWRFLPAQHNGRCVKARMIIPVRFAETSAQDGTSP